MSDLDALAALAAAGVGDLPSLLAPPAWQRDAACSGDGFDRYFAGDTDTVLDALEVCDGCPVQPDCLAHALEHDEAGIWGATTEAQRAAMQRGRPVPERPSRRKPATNVRHDAHDLLPHRTAEGLQPCGTPAAYMRHRRRGEEACEDCREAQRLKGVKRRAAA